MLRSIVHIPFVPFSILFSNVVQFFNLADLERLDNFAASLQPDAVDGQGSITHPHRLYHLLCQAARLYINSKNTSFPGDAGIILQNPDMFGFSTFGDELGETESESFHALSLQTHGLNDWYQNNQQITRFLMEDSIL